MEETENTQESLGAWDKLAEFFLDDDQSRWKAIRWITAIAGTLGAVDLVFFKASVDEAVSLMGFFLLLMSFLWLAWYTSFSHSQKEKRVAVFMTRRDLIWQGASLLAFLTAVRVQSAEARNFERKLREAANDANEAKQVLDKGRSAGIRIAPTTIEDTGKKFLSAAANDRTNSDAWSAALAFIDYRSFLGARVDPSLENPYLPDVRVFYRPGAGPDGSFFARGSGRVPIAQAARFNNIGDDWNKERPSGHAFLLVQGTKPEATIMIDNKDIKNVVIRDFTVEYTGGPLRLENACFVNCEFRLLKTDNGILFAAQLLNSPCITLTTA